MYCIAYLACILVAVGLSSAADVEPRGEIRYDLPGSNLKEAANPSHAHNLPRGYIGRRTGHLRGRDDGTSAIGSTRLDVPRHGASSH